MDNLLNEIGLEVEFQIYNIIAFTADDGLLQFVPNSMTITDITDIKKEPKFNGSIEGFLRHHSKNDQKLFEKM